MAYTEKQLIDFETNLAKAFEEGKINCPLHLCGGNERELINIFKYIKQDDYVFSGHRSHYHYLLKGGDANRLIDEIYGYPTGVCKGKARSMNICDPSIKFYTSAIVAGICSIATGVALAIKHDFGGDTEEAQKTRPKVWCFIGDGAEDSGYFIEAVRFANARNLPITFIIEDNDYSIDSTKAQRWHNHVAIESDNNRIIRYHYTRRYPHVGIGKFITF